MASPGNDLVAIRPAGDKGMGLFATQPIPRGTRILCEEPLLALPAGSTDSKKLHEQLPSLTGAALDKFRALHSPEAVFPEELREQIHFRLSTTYTGSQLEHKVAEEIELRLIFNTNCVAMGPDNKYGIGVFELYSRINHSCTPNVNNFYNPELQRETVHAVRDIAQDEEIETSYAELIRNVDMRRRRLGLNGFECRCEACYGPSAAAHEVRRQRIADIDQQLALGSMGTPMSRMMGAIWAGPGPSDAEAVRLLEEYIVLLKEEGLVGMDLAKAYHDCTSLCIAQGKLQDALRYNQLDRETELICLGPETTYMVGNSAYAMTSLEEIRRRVMDLRLAPNVPASRPADSSGARGGSRVLSRAERRALAREEAKAAKGQGPRRV